MSYEMEYIKKFNELESSLQDITRLSLSANGGKTIIFSFSPKYESQYIEEAKKRYKEEAMFIDLSKIFVKYIDFIGVDNFKALYKDYTSTPYMIFKDDSDDNKDFFDMIIEEINNADNLGKIPILIRTGILYGTGIENQNILEHNVVMKLKQALILFYPSKLENNDLLFLNFKTASRYRALLIN
jgi:hypothetical protein